MSHKLKKALLLAFLIRSLMLPLQAAAPEFGFLWICVVRAAEHSGEPQKLVPRAVIGVRHPKANVAASFTVTDETGYVLIPLRPGNYCADAYDSHGTKLRLDGQTNNGRSVCFGIRGNEITEAGVTIAHDQEVKTDFPSKGID